MSAAAGGPPEPDLTDPSAYVERRREVVRYNDLDTLGHVTSLAFINFCESARVLFLRDAGQPIDDPVTGWMIVNLSMDFHAELRFPQVVETGTRVLRIGNTSITTGQALFADGRCAAVQRTTLVLVDRGSGRPQRVGDALRERLLQSRP